MIRPLTIATFLLACGSGLYLYQSKHDAQVLDRTIEKAVHDTAAYREQSRLLAAEWTMLNDPETLRRFSDKYLALKSITPSQFTSLADLDSRLPAVETPVASNAEPQTLTPADAAPESGPATPAAVVENPAVATVDTATPIPPRPVPPAPAMVSAAPTHAVERAAERPTERKIATARIPNTDGAAKPVGADPAASSRVVASSEAHQSERRATQVAEPRPGESKIAEVRPPIALPRPTVVATASRPNAVAPAGGAEGRGHPAPPIQASTGAAPYSGSLLGMARGTVAPQLPRPTPVNATQWYNAN